MAYGFGRIVGLGAAIGIAAAYILFTAGVNGVTSYFAQTSILDLSGGSTWTGASTRSASSR